MQMPELPEVETMRRGVLAITGATIVAARRTPCAKRNIVIQPRIDHFNKRAAGKRIVSVDRLGKRVVLTLDSNDRIVIEPRMTGLVLVGPPPNLQYLRFCLKLRGSRVPELLFWDRRGLGTVQLLDETRFEDLRRNKVGPDALEIRKPELLRDRFRSSRREIKVALLDQSAIAGIGNLYACEILHRAGIDPRRPCRGLRIGDWARICDSIEAVLTAAIRHEGSTLADGTYRNALNDPGQYQVHHAVYDRAGQECRSCRRGIVQRIVQAQRSTFLCDVCQGNSRRKRKQSTGLANDAC
jgi:formamidopyrimidine-DNA glycosylase